MRLSTLLIALLVSAYIGYLAQITGLCLVRGVGDWVNGRRARPLAMLTAGFWIYLYLPLLPPDDIPLYLQRHELHWGFLLGGLIFGLGAAVNGACSVSTASRLSTGDMRMVFTVMGWLAGWLVLEYFGIGFGYITLDEMHAWLPRLSWALPGLLALIGAYVYFRRREDWRIWSGIMLVGMLAGVAFLLQPDWPLSNLVRDFGLAIIRRDPELLPIIDRMAILMTMLLGMGIGAWKYRRFRLVVPALKEIHRHFSAGILMGAGTAIALGGNDFQLLLALPAMSLAGLIAIFGMVLGVRIGIGVIGNQAPPAVR